MVRCLVLASVIVICVAGCGAPPTATPDAVATGVAEAQAVVATLTALAPTATPTYIPTSTPTNTATPTATRTPTLTPTHTPTPTITPMPAPTLIPTPTRPLPELYVDGPLIKRKDTGEAVQLKGVSINTFVNGGQTFSEAKRYIDIARNWKSNLIRLQLDIGKLRPDELEKAIDYAESNGMYVVLTPEGINSNSFQAPTQESHDMIISLASRFKGRRNVLYGLMNEVGNVKGDRWYEDLIDTAEDIMMVNQGAIVVMSGAYWNRDFSVAQRHPFPFTNTVYDVHYYQATDDAGTDVTAQHMNFAWMVGKYPILFGEAGVLGANGGRFSPNDSLYVRLMLEMVSQNPLIAHYTGYEFAPGGWNTSLLNSGGSPSNRGQLYYADMATSPPTDFSK